MSHRILIVDDEEDIRSLVALLLDNAGYQVREACDGKEGLALLTEHGADVVILDIMMPGMSGWEVCRHIRATPELAHTPVIILTVRSLLKDQEALDVAHADGFINKPFEMKALLSEVQRVLAARATV